MLTWWVGAFWIKGGHAAKTITVKMKCVDFSIKQRSVSVSQAVRTDEQLFGHAHELLQRELPLQLRLLGVRASALVALAPTEHLSKRHDGKGKRQLAIDAFAGPAVQSGDDCVGSTESDEEKQEDDAWEEDECAQILSCRIAPPGGDDQDDNDDQDNQGARRPTLKRSRPCSTESLAVAPKAIRKKIRQPTQKTGLLTW